MVLSQSERVKNLGLDGEDDAVTNFARMLLSRGHGAQLQVDGYTLALDTQQVPRLASVPTHPGRWWPLPIPDTQVPERAVLADCGSTTPGDAPGRWRVDTDVLIPTLVG